MKYLSTMRHPFYRLLLLLLIIWSVDFWISKTVEIISENDSYKFSNNTFSGVRLSRSIDARPPAGRISGMVSYADFLSASTNFISRTKKEKAGVFIDQEELSFEVPTGSLHGKPLMMGKLDPQSKMEQFFGIQSLIKFKLVHSNSALNALNNKWVKLRNRSNVEMVAYLEKIDDDVAWIRGDIPIGFFPNEIEIIESQKQHSPAHVQLFSEETNTIRGGVVTTKDRNIVYVQHIPIAKQLPLLGRFRYYPRKNDLLHLNSGKKYTIESVLLVGGGFFLELDQPITPYFDSNNDIVEIIPQGDNYSTTTVIKISPQTDDDYFFGRERFMNINMRLIDKHVSAGDYLKRMHGSQRYYIAKLTDTTVTIDLLTSKIFNLCNRFISKDITLKEELIFNNKTIQSQYLNNKQSCEMDDVKNILTQNVLGDFLENSIGNSEKYRPILDMDIDRVNAFRNKSLNEISILEAFKLSLNLPISYSCKSCELVRDNVKKSFQSAPTIVYGNGDIWETYPGSMLNIFYGTENPAEPELMIHALGDEIAGSYYNKFKENKPSFVAFANPRQFTPWLYTWHWPFFEQLLLNYKQHFSNSDFSLWYRTSQHWRVPPLEWDNTIPLANNKSFHLPFEGDEELTVYSVSVEYTIENPFESLPLIGKSARLLVSINNANTETPIRPPVSLPLSENKFSFPVFVKGNSKPELEVHLIDPFKLGVNYSLKSVSWRKVLTETKNVEDLLYYAPAFKAVAGIF